MKLIKYSKVNHRELIIFKLFLIPIMNDIISVLTVAGGKIVKYSIKIFYKQKILWPNIDWLMAFSSRDCIIENQNYSK